MLKKLKGLFLEEEGQGMTEYGLILGLIAAGVVTVLVLMGPKIKAMFEGINNQITG